MSAGTTKAQVSLAGRPYEVQVEPAQGGWKVTVNGTPHLCLVNASGPGYVVWAGAFSHVVVPAAYGEVQVDGVMLPFAIRSLHLQRGAGQAGSGTVQVRPPMTGRLDAIRVASGQRVRRGQTLFVLEAMKMRNEVKAPCDGVVGRLLGKVGANVQPAHVVLEVVAD
jgi:glutaconyl-CoA/methylmalonyl-CoA decarboxylase subunit gamma